MRNWIILFVSAVFVIAVPARAQIYLITASGTLTGGSGVYSSVPAGSTFIMTETFNLATATLTASSGSSVTYTDPDGSSSFAFDGYTITGTAPEIQITSDDVIASQAIYGFEFSQPLSGGSYAVQLLTANSADAPSTSLASLHSLQTASFSDFENAANIAAYEATAGNVGGGKTTTLLVQVEAVPEPSSLALSVPAVLLLFWLHRRRQQKRAAA